MVFYNKIISIIVITTFLSISFSCNEQKNENKKVVKIKYSGKPVIKFENNSYDFGTLEEGEIVECSFKYKNTGTAPLKITKIITDCGCTVPKYDKKAVLPKEESKIKVTFDSRGFRNNIYKTITVKTNADSSKILLILTAFIKNNNTLNY